MPDGQYVGTRCVQVRQSDSPPACEDFRLFDTPFYEATGDRGFAVCVDPATNAK